MQVLSVDRCQFSWTDDQRNVGYW